MDKSWIGSVAFTVFFRLLAIVGIYCFGQTAVVLTIAGACIVAGGALQRRWQYPLELEAPDLLEEDPYEPIEAC